MRQDFGHPGLEPHVARGITGSSEQNDLKAYIRLMNYRNETITQSGSATKMRAPTATMFRGVLGIAALLTFSACAQLNPSAPPRLDGSGSSVQGIYSVTPENVANVRQRALETVNNTRSASGVAAVVLEPALILAADEHSRSMAQQRRAWHFGTDGSSPMDRARRAGFSGNVLGELVSETYESEVQTIATWMGNSAQRALLLDPEAQRIGIGVFQEPGNRLWWTMTIAD